MSAAFVSLSDGADIFKSATGAAQHLVSIPGLDNLVSGSSGVAVYNSVGVQLNEVIQFFGTFDDVVKVTHFGKGVGSYTVDGSIFVDCSGSIAGLDVLLGAIRGMRGKLQTLTLGSGVFTAILNSVQLNVVAEPETMVNFALNLSVVNHNL